MELKKAFFAIIAVSMVTIAIGITVNEWNADYGSGLTSDLTAYNKLGNISDTAGTQQGNINPQSGEASSDFETETFRGGYGIITSIFSPLRVVFGDGGMIDSVTERFGIPDYVRQGIVSMMIIAITFTIVAIVFRLGRDSA
jgi:hypothetical protein